MSSRVSSFNPQEPIKSPETIESLQAQAESINKSIPDRTETLADKRKVLIAKEQIIQIKRKIAAQINDPQKKAEIAGEIRTLEQERDTLKDEISSIAMASSVFDSSESTETAPNKSNYKNSIWS